MAAAMAIADASFLLDATVVSDDVSSSALLARMAMPLSLRSPELSVNAVAAVVATARLSVVAADTPRS